MRTRALGHVSALGLTLVLSLGACSSGPSEEAAPAQDTSSVNPAGHADALLAELGLDGLSGQEIVDQLEASPDQRPLPFGASVREDHLLMSTETQEVAVPLPQDQFYVSVAPFVEQTHECYYHSLATCRGELADQEVDVLITDGDGTVLVDETVTTGPNGFTGFWLPRGIEGGSLAVTYDDHEGSVPLSTTEGSPTCVTTLQLEPEAA